MFVFSVCADGSVVCYLWGPACGGELRFLYCDDVRLCCAHEMLEFLHGAYYVVCVELRNFISLCFVLEVFCLFRVWECASVGM